MQTIRRHFDRGSIAVVGITLALFVAALFVHGLTHTLLLEAGVFLVSVKLILMTYKLGVANDAILERLDEIQAALERAEAERAKRDTRA